MRRALEPNLETTVRAHDRDESQRPRKEGIGVVFLGVKQLARGAIKHIVQRFAPPAMAAHRQPEYREPAWCRSGGSMDRYCDPPTPRSNPLGT